MRRTYATAMAVFLLFLALIGCGGNGPVASRPTTLEPSSATDPTRDPPPNFGMHRLAGSGLPGADTCIIVHGLFDTTEDMVELAGRFKQGFGFRNVYGMAYNWRIGTVQAAQYLGTQLDSLRSVGKRVTLVGHSRGCLIIRYALEKMNKTDCVKRVFLLNGPHRGSGYATMAQLLLALGSSLLSDDYGNGIDLSASYPAIRELIPNNPLLQDLNTPNFGAQRGNIDYFIFAGERDLVVPRNSGMANSVNLDGVVNGSINRWVMNGATHGSVRHSATDFAAIMSRVNLFADSDVEVRFNPQPAWDYEYGWMWWVEVRNHGDRSVLLKTITFDSYDKFGNWLGCTWFPADIAPGVFFPAHYAEWNRSLPAGRQAVIGLADAANRNVNFSIPTAQMPEHMRARNLIHSVVYEKDGRRFDARATLIERFGTEWPSTPKTRSRDSAGQEGGLATVTLRQAPVFGPITE